mgnify:FL=1|jgi:hypothetical protein
MDVDTLALYDAEDEDEDTTEWETGPFCQHFSDPSDCEELCLGCSHGCPDHERSAESGKPRVCTLPGCPCQGWVERD